MRTVKPSPVMLCGFFSLAFSSPQATSAKAVMIQAALANDLRNTPCTLRAARRRGRAGGACARFSSRARRPRPGREAGRDDRLGAFMGEVLFFLAGIGAVAGAIGVIALRNPFFSVLALVSHLVSL